MSDLNSNIKPRLVSTGQGFSILNTVEYKDRLLYSKYNPTKAVVATINNMALLPGTLLVVCSPCLWYGLTELLNKMPDGCIILAIEADNKLFEFSKAELSKLRKTFSTEQNSRIYFLNISDSAAQESFPLLLQIASAFIKKTGGQGTLKRAVRIDFSAGVSFSPSVYESFCSATENIIAQFWKNRITLVKLGRLYARNLFKNLSSLKHDCTLTSVANTVPKPIIVCGAGEGLSSVLDDESIKKLANEKKVYLLAVDASLPSLLEKNILPDAVIGVESQSAIEKAYLSAKDSRLTLFADLTSRPNIKNILGGRTIWFCSKYSDAKYLEKIKEYGIIESFIPPLGSVGLSAVYISLLLRKDENIPVYVCGLDFSFTKGATHAKGTPAHITRLIATSRFSPVENYDSAFRSGAVCVKGKNGKLTCTDSIMKNYAENFISMFCGTKNLFDISSSGLDIMLPYADKIEFNLHDGKNKNNDCVSTENYLTKNNLSVNNEIRKALSSKIDYFYAKEKNALTAIKDLLSNGDISIYRDPTLTFNEQLTELLQNRDYLYLHFPDGYNFSTDISFLKRIRAEIDFFIKDIDFAMN